MMRRLHFSILLCPLLAGVVPAAAFAQADAPFDPAQVRRLSPEEKERILANSSEAAADASLMSAMGGGRSNQVHGEIGVMAGTGGALGVSGTALLPLGEHGSAIISFSRSQFGDTVRPRR